MSYPFAQGEIYDLSASQEKVAIGYDTGVSILQLGDEKAETIMDIKSEEPIKQVCLDHDLITSDF